MARTNGSEEEGYVLALRPEGAARALGVSTGTLRAWVDQGLISPPYNFGPRIILFCKKKLDHDWENMKDRAERKITETEENIWDSFVKKP